MDNKNTLITIAVAIAILIIGYLFVEYNTWFGYMESSILYLTAVIGAGCYWIGTNCNK